MAGAAAVGTIRFMLKKGYMHCMCGVMAHCLFIVLMLGILFACKRETGGENL